MPRLWEHHPYPLPIFRLLPLRGFLTCSLLREFGESPELRVRDVTTKMQERKSAAFIWCLEEAGTPAAFETGVLVR